MAVLAFAVGCGPGAAGRGARNAGAERLVAPGSITDENFAPAVRDLLAAEPGSAERAASLRGVVSLQMDRAEALFHRRSAERGVAAVTGGLLLLRTGDLKADTLGPNGPAAIAAAGKSLSARGEEGRSRAIFEILGRVGTPAQQADSRFHLEALADWTRDTEGADYSIGGAADLQAQAVQRALLEPSQAALDDAVQASVNWIERARERVSGRPRGSLSPYERAEAIRALQSAGSTVVGLYLREGDAAGALKAITRAKLLPPLVPEHLYKAVSDVADKPTADRWIEVLRALFPAESDGGQQDEDDPVLDRSLLRGAAFTVASEAYRLDPTRLEAAATIAEALGSFGMSEASPAVLEDACRAHPDAQTLSFALQTTVRAMDEESQDGQPDAARRVFRAAKPILDIALKAKVAGLKPSPAFVQASMGEIELREGRLDAARGLFAASIASGPGARALLDLARIEQHDGKDKEAAAHLAAALALPEASRDVALRAELLLSSSEVHQKLGDAAGASTALTDAFRLLAPVHAAGDPRVRARVERVFARVLDRFGMKKAASDALERAYAAAPRDKAEVAATLALVASRAYVQGDLAAAREALSRGVGADLDDEDLVYIALWVQGLEREQHVNSNGVAERVFVSIADDGRWSSRLAAFGRGKIDEAALLRAATSPSRKAEALFYGALERRAKGDAAGAKPALAQVASGDGVDLMESQMARQLLGTALPPVAPPPGLTVP